jgi:hypothetical protein
MCTPEKSAGHEFDNAHHQDNEPYRGDGQITPESELVYRDDDELNSEFGI